MKEEQLLRRYKKKRRVVISISIIILTLLYTLKNTSFLIRAMSTIGLLFVFYLVDHLFKLDFKDRHYVFISAIAITGFLLSPLYFIYPNYDKILHIILPIMFASIVFHMVDLLKLELKWKLLFTFFIVIGSLGMFEIGEYLLDWLFDLKLQGVYIRDLQGIQRFNILQDKIDDTMIDMSLGIFGTAVYVLTFGLYRKITKQYVIQSRRN